MLSWVRSCSNSPLQPPAHSAAPLRAKNTGFTGVQTLPGPPAQPLPASVTLGEELYSGLIFLILSLTRLVWKLN